MRKRHWMRWIAIVATIVTLASLAALVVFLFSTELHGDKLGAAAAVLGGALGAAGTGLAVYLTLSAQRDDEADKVESTLRMEAAEFGRLAVGRLSVCEEILAKRARIPMTDLLPIMTMPEAIVYKATADRVSRLSYGALFVAFHARIAEAVSMAEMIAAKKTPDAFGGRPSPPLVVDDGTARILLTAWFDVCDIARSILRPSEHSNQIVDRIAKECLVDLDAAHKRVAEIAAAGGA